MDEATIRLASPTILDLMTPSSTLCDISHPATDVATVLPGPDSAGAATVH